MPGGVRVSDDLYHRLPWLDELVWCICNTYSLPTKQSSIVLTYLMVCSTNCHHNSSNWDVVCVTISTHWGRVKHISVSKLTVIGADNDLSPGWRQAIWTNVCLLLIRNLVTNVSYILSENHTFTFQKLHLKISSAQWRQFYFGLDVLSDCCRPRFWCNFLKFATISCNTIIL